MQKYTFNLNTKYFGRTAYMIEFYEKLGVQWRNNDVRNFLINPKDNLAIKHILGRTKVNYSTNIEDTWRGLKITLKRGTYLNEKHALLRATFDWCNYAPKDSPEVPCGELWVLEEGDAGGVDPVLR